MNIVEKVKSNKYVVVLTTLFTVITAIFGLYTGIISFKHELGGSLNASIKNYSLNNNETRTIVVCFDTPSIDMSHLFITPTFDNPSEYSLKDFSLEYEVICHNINFQPNTLVSAHELGNNKTLYKYNENTLSAYGDTKQPFSSFTITGGNIGRCEINTKATYDGAPSPFYYRTDVWFIHEPNRRNVSFDFWKANCKTVIFKNISTMHYDVHYLAQNAPYEHQFDVALQAKEEHEKTTGTAYSSNRQVAKKQDNISQPVSQPAPAPKETPVVKKEQPVAKGTASSNGDLQIVSYKTVEYEKTTTTTFTFNKKPVGQEYYLLTYNISIDDEKQKYLAYSEIEVSGVSSLYKFTLNNQNYRGKPHPSDFKLTKPVVADDYIETKTSGDMLEIVNNSNSKIVCVIESKKPSGPIYYYKELNPKGMNKINIANIESIHVYNIDNISPDSSLLQKNYNFWDEILFILALFSTFCLIMFLWIIFEDSKETKYSFADSFKSFFADMSKDIAHPKGEFLSIFGTILIFCILPIYSILYWLYCLVFGKFSMVAEILASFFD